MPDTSRPQRPSYVLFADGSAKGPELGWGVILWRGNSDQVLTLSGGEKCQPGYTAFSEVAEWRAAIEALTLLGAKKRPVWLLSDCASVVAFLNGLARNEPKGVDTFIGRVGARLVFQLGQLALAFPKLQALKVKGHAGSHGNTMVDKLATVGREDQRVRKGVLPLKPALEEELGTLLSTGSAEYSFIVPPGTPDPHMVAKEKKRAGKVVHKLSPEAIQALTKDMVFELTPAEKAAVASRAREMLTRADKMPSRTKRQKNTRRSALDRASGHAKNATRQLLQEKRKAAALKLANGG